MEEKKGLLARILDKVDGKLEKKAKAKGACSCCCESEGGKGGCC
jgi:hypothetical protein